MTPTVLFSLLGGVGLFLYGMTVMSYLYFIYNNYIT